MQGPSDLRLTLFGCWRLMFGQQTVDVPWRSRRVVTLLALRGQQARTHLAGMLWPDVPEERAQASLRTALSRLRRYAPGLIQHGNGELQLSDRVTVDVIEFHGFARQVLSGNVRDVLAPADHPTVAGGELLPGWYDDWVVVERERIHQMRLHVLEALVGRLIERSAYAQALQAALTAVEIDPLRESAQRSLIRVHLAEGNTADAVRQYEKFRSILHVELDVEPTHRMTALIDQATTLASEHRRDGPGRRRLHAAASV